MLLGIICRNQWVFQHSSWLHSIKCTELYGAHYGHVTGMRWQVLFRLSQYLKVKPSLTLKSRDSWCILRVLELVCWSCSFHAVFPGPGKMDELRWKKRRYVFHVYLLVHILADIFDISLIQCGHRYSPLQSWWSCPNSLLTHTSLPQHVAVPERLLIKRFWSSF